MEAAVEDVQLEVNDIQYRKEYLLLPEFIDKEHSVQYLNSIELKEYIDDENVLEDTKPFIFQGTDQTNWFVWKIISFITMHCISFYFKNEFAAKTKYFTFQDQNEHYVLSAEETYAYFEKHTSLHLLDTNEAFSAYENSKIPSSLGVFCNFLRYAYPNQIFEHGQYRIECFTILDTNDTIFC